MSYRIITEGAGQQLLAQLEALNKALADGTDAEEAPADSYADRGLLTEETGRAIAAALYVTAQALSGYRGTQDTAEAIAGGTLSVPYAQALGSEGAEGDIVPEEAGSESVPVYFSGGKPVACGAVGEALSAGQDGEGNTIADTYATKSELESGLAEKQDTLTFDAEPAEGSANPVTSDGVYAAVEGLREDVEDGTVTAASATYATSAGSADTATSATTAAKLGSSTVGSGVKPIYLSAGEAVASSSTVGSGTKPVYLSSGTLTASSSTVGSGTKPVYLSSGTLTVSSSTVGSVSTPVYLSSGTVTACTSVAAETASTADYAASAGSADTATSATTADALSVTAAIGSDAQPVYIGSTGVPVACTSVAAATASTADYATSSGSADTATSATTAAKLGSDTVGSGTKPIYLSAGEAVASSSTVGSGTKPVYLSSGTLTASSSTVGSSTTPVYLSSGTVTACTSVAAATASTADYATSAGSADTATSATTAETLGSDTVGSGTKPIYLKAGEAVASSAYVGSYGVPIYLKAGTLTECTSITADQLGSSTVGGTLQPIYLKSGTATAIGTGSSVGGTCQPVYLNSSGVITACSSNMGYYYKSVSMPYAHDSGSAETPTSGKYSTTSTATFYCLKFGSHYMYYGKCYVADDTNIWTRLDLSDLDGSTTRCVTATPQKSSTSGYTPGVIVYYSGDYVYFAIDENLTSTVTYVHLTIVRS